MNVGLVPMVKRTV